MKVDQAAAIGELGGAAAAAATAEAAGYDGYWTAETSHDPFLPLVGAAQATERIDVGTSIAVAFARNPMSTAVVANDLQVLSQGRFTLGLGSQIEAHITRRFSMEWSRPAARMREFIVALRAIWASWHEGTRLDFRGDFYTHTLMTPFFDPGPNEHGPPRVYLAGVGERMTAVAAEVCDGFLCHGFTTEAYLRQVTIPALEAGRDVLGKTLEGFEISAPVFVVTGQTEEQMASAAVATRRQLAFYGSTPAYRSVLELHGWGCLQDELNKLSKAGRWADMTELIDDETLRTFAVVAEPEQIGRELDQRYGDILTRLSFYAPYRSDPSCWTSAVAHLGALP